jgi:hypothetical protein
MPDFSERTEKARQTREKNAELRKQQAELLAEETKG